MADQRPWWLRFGAQTAPEDDARSEDDVLLPDRAASLAAAPAQESTTPAITAEQKALLDACQAAGITSAAQVAQVAAEAATARSAASELKAYSDEVQAYLQEQAVRLYGPDKGPEIATGYEKMPVAERRERAEVLAAEADAKFGIGKGHGAPRQTTPAKPAEAAPTAPRFAQDAAVAGTEEKQKASEQSTLAQTELGRKALARRNKSK